MTGKQQIGPHCPINLLDCHDGPEPVLLWLKVDNEKHERGERINGYIQCPRCGLWNPVIEEPDKWTLDEETEIWKADGWFGGVVCCGLLMVEQPDGQLEAYSIRDER